VFGINGRPRALSRSSLASGDGQSDPFRDDDLVGGSAQLMAHRQLVVSLVVAFALLAVAGLRMATAPHEKSAGMAAGAAIMRAETPQKAVAQPRPGMIPG
jgi:hypothetical protein